MAGRLTAARQFKQTYSFRNLGEIYLNHIKESGAIGIDRVRPAKLEANLRDHLQLISKKVALGTYEFTAYKEKLISKGQGVPPRVISIPTARDRIVLRALCDLISGVFPETKTRLPQTVIDSLQDALSCGRFAEYIKIDLKNFYPSIPHTTLTASLKGRIRKLQILSLIQKAIETPTVPENKGGKAGNPNLCGVPQGLAISNVLAETALLSVDSQLKARMDIWYSRYVDDILILTPLGRATQVAEEVVQALKELGLTPHPPSPSGSKSKTAPLTESFSFLGYEICNGKTSIRRDSILKFEASLAKIFTAYRYRLVRAKSAREKATAIALCKWKLNLRITGCIFEGRRLGWVFYFSQVTTTDRLRAINKTIEKLIDRFNLTHEIQPKSLIKTYYESKRKNKSSHGYIPNFDEMTPAQQRDILSLLLGHEKIAHLTDRRVSELFKMRMSVAVRELEADLSGMS